MQKNNKQSSQHAYSIANLHVKTPVCNPNMRSSFALTQPPYSRTLVCVDVQFEHVCARLFSSIWFGSYIHSVYRINSNWWLNMTSNASRYDRPYSNWITISVFYSYFDFSRKSISIFNVIESVCCTRRETLQIFILSLSANWLWPKWIYCKCEESSRLLWFWQLFLLYAFGFNCVYRACRLFVVTEKFIFIICGGFPKPDGSWNNEFIGHL